MREKANIDALTRSTAASLNLSTFFRDSPIATFRAFRQVHKNFASAKAIESQQ